MYRGRDISSAEIDNITKKYLNREYQQFVEWIPHNVKTAIITLKPQNVENTATMVGNITSVKDCFERIWENFHKLFEKKAFLHWYKGEGMHEMEFLDAESQIKDLIMEYFEKQEIRVNFEELFPEEDQYEEESVESIEINLPLIQIKEKDDEMDKIDNIDHYENNDDEKHIN